jgi:hypothetical protein
MAWRFLRGGDKPSGNRVELPVLQGQAPDGSPDESPD